MSDSTPNGLPFDIQNLIARIPVNDQQRAVEFYSRWLGRAPDEVGGLAEWDLGGGRWLQISDNGDGAIPVVVIIGVADVEQARAASVARGVEAEEIQDYGVVRISNIKDPDGNNIALAQEVAT